MNDKKNQLCYIHEMEYYLVIKRNELLIKYWKDTEEP